MRHAHRDDEFDKELAPKILELEENHSFLHKLVFYIQKIRSVLLLNSSPLFIYTWCPNIAASDLPVYKAVESIMDPAPFSAVRFVMSAIPFVLRARDDVKMVKTGIELGLWSVWVSLLRQLVYLQLMLAVMVVPMLDSMLGAIIPARTWFGILMSALGVAMPESAVLRRTQDMDTSSLTWEMLWDWMMAFPWVPALYTGIWSTGLCQWIEIAAMREVSATETAIIYPMEPVWALVLHGSSSRRTVGHDRMVGLLSCLGKLNGANVGHIGRKKTDRREKGNPKGNPRRVSEMDKGKLQKKLSTSPIVVRTRKDVRDLF
ncbi:hypothetical protein F3Y22_tig00109926pilonHSYRG00161 [Hibiscus syriacus]|uniref:Uncharacterized protein n=1 Tax=Hibiscus syriacus TaxID=106335 RepID=A0A6A3BSD7_HIBSY|nr:hypothetical protein F3Y22_tig00109926pilonHSYRG00161 [Hibiscus syriacus]